MVYTNTDIPNVEKVQQQNNVSTSDDWSPWMYMDLKWGKQTNDGLGLLLTISFGDHYKKIFGGDIWFGLRASKLQLVTKHARVPHKHRWPDASLRDNIEVKRTVREATSSKHTQSYSEGLKANAGIKNASASASSSRRKEAGEEKSDFINDEFEHVDWKIYSSGSENKAYWSFEALPAEPCLRGHLLEKEICKIISSADSYGVQATLSVFKKDIQILSGQGLWPEDIGKSKKTVILSLLRRHIANKIGPEVQSLELQRPA